MPGGEILIDGSTVAITDPIAAKQHGHRDHLPGAEPRAEPDRGREHLSRRRDPSAAASIDRKAMDDGCRPVLERLGAPFRPETIVGTLSIAEQQLVEIARALHAEVEDPGARRADHRPVVARDRAPVRPDPPAAQRGHRADLHQPPHGRGLRAVRPRLGAARRLAMSARSSGARLSADALVKMMVGRDLSSFYKKEHDPQAAAAR